MSYHGRSKTRLTVSVIDTNDALFALKAEWSALEDRDPEATFFLSWDWLAQAFQANPHRWTVLAVRDAADGHRLVGLLPLKYRLHWSTTRSEFQTEIEAGGRLAFSEYTGFLCDPALQHQVMTALARTLATMPWARLSMRYVAQQSRASQFCAAFEDMGLPVRWKDYRINNGETDNLICPRVALPDDFETYLQTSVSANTRQRYRRFKRQYFTSGEYHFTHSDPDTLDADIATLMRFWIEKWRPQKGERSARKVAANFETVLRNADQAGALFLPTLWKDDTPLGALGHIMDPRDGTMHFIIAGRNIAAQEPFLGAALHFHSIECAILLGSQVYDFGHGDEAYKFSYGAEPTKLLYFSIERPGTQDVFDPTCTGAALKRIDGFLKDGKTSRARRACQQLSKLFGAA